MDIEALDFPYILVDRNGGSLNPVFFKKIITCDEDLEFFSEMQEEWERFVTFKKEWKEK